MCGNSFKFLVFSLVIAALTLEQSAVETEALKRATICTAEVCKEPSCRCSNSKLPSAGFEGREKELPQFITVTFDDAVNTLNYAQYEQLFANLTNPDGCAAHGTFFVSHEYTDYSKVHALYRAGHEIALHSITHATGTDYWRNADIDLILREFGQEFEIMAAFAKVQRRHIRGMRLPYLQISGNNSFEAARRLGLSYDSSWPTQKFKDPPMWPYTLDYRSTQDCQIGPCPDAAISGFWVSPMVSWNDVRNYSCAMIDGCVYMPKDDVDEIFKWMLSNFERHYESNRAPFGMYLHAALFGRGHNYFKAFKNFLQHVNKLPDVYVTTMANVIKYMHHPTLGKPFKGCFKKPNTEQCIPKSCNLKKVISGETRYMTVCGDCPEVYPWLDNPLGKKIKP